MRVLVNVPDQDTLEVCSITEGVYQSISGDHDLSDTLQVPRDVTLECQSHTVYA